MNSQNNVMNTIHKTNNLTLITILLWLSVLLAQLADSWLGQSLSIAQRLDRLLPSILVLTTISLPAIFIGLRLLPKTYPNLVLPQQAALPNYLLIGTPRQWLIYPILGAFFLGFVMLALSLILSAMIESNLPPLGHRGAFRGFLVSVGAAIGEEVWFRLGITSLAIITIQKLRRQTSPSNSTLWWAILVPGVLFGLAHIPQVIGNEALTTTTFLYTLAGNFIVSAYFGWCFVRFGIVAAMLAHLCVDIPLHVISALL